MTSIDLREITRGLQEAASATNSLIAQQYINLFDQFFECDTEALGAPMKAKMVEVAMDGQHIMRVPCLRWCHLKAWPLSACRSTCR